MNAHYKKRGDAPIRNHGTGEVVCIDVTNIDLYDKNPRRSRNPAYDRIKASIAANGIDQPLIVTQRPDEERYVVHAGGNTRLRILKELFAASNDPTFGMVNCILVPWNSESTVLLAHLRENDLRGELNFIDKAVAVCALEELLIEEMDCDKLTVRKLQDVLRERGYTISMSLISYMRYAVNVLLPVMPVSLSEGLGRRQIHKIRQLHSIAGDVWVAQALGPEEEFESIFSELCRRNDSADWRIDTLKQAVENEIAEAADISVHVVRLHLEMAMSGTPMIDDIPLISASGSGLTDSRQSEGKHQPKIRNVGATVVVDVDDEPVAMMVDSGSKSSSKETGEFRQLRELAFLLAERLARHFGFAESIIPTPDTGLGYLIADLPNESTFMQLDQELRIIVGTMWWHLVAFSELVQAPDEVTEEKFSDESPLRSILVESRPRDLLSEIPIVDAPAFSNEFWARLGDEDSENWIRLAKTVRQLHQLSIEHERPLWEAAA